MGKGVLPDSDPLNVIAARSFALKSADVVVVAGARLNWILHFGQPPRFAADVKVIQLDVCAEAMGDNADVIATLLGGGGGGVGGQRRAFQLCFSVV